MAYKLTRQADYDLGTIYEYSLVNFGLMVADRYLADLLNTFELITQSPKMGVKTFKHFRRLPAGEYIIFYEIDGKDIIIVRIMHGQMRHHISHLLSE